MVKPIINTSNTLTQVVSKFNTLADNVGDTAILETTSKEIVGAINEISEVNNGGARITELDAKIDANKVISDDEDARLDTDLTALEQRFDTEQGDYANINSLLERSRNGFYDGGYSIKDNFTYPTIDALKDVYTVIGGDPVLLTTDDGIRYINLFNNQNIRSNLSFPRTQDTNKVRVRAVCRFSQDEGNFIFGGFQIKRVGNHLDAGRDQEKLLLIPGIQTININSIIFLEMEYYFNSSTEGKIVIRAGRYDNITQALLPGNSWNCLNPEHANHSPSTSLQYNSTTGETTMTNENPSLTPFATGGVQLYQLDILVGDGANEITTTSSSKTDEARFVGIDAEVLDLENRMDDIDGGDDENAGILHAHDARITANVAKVSDVEEASGEGIDQTDIVHNEISGQDQIGSFNFTPVLSSVANGEKVLMSGYFRFGVDREEGFDPNVSLRLYNTASSPRVLVKDFKQVEPSESFYWESDVVLGDSHTLEYESVEGGASVTYTPRIFALKYSFKGIYYDVIKNLISASTEERFNTNERVITNLRNDVADVKVANANQETEIDFNKQEIHTNATTLTALSEFVHTDAGNILLQGNVSGDSTVNTVATEANNNLNGGSPFVLRTSAGTNSAFRVVNVKDSTGAMSIGGHEIIRKTGNTVVGLIRRPASQPADITENVLLSNGTGTTTFEEPITGATAFGLDGSAVGINNVIVNAHLVINGRDYDNVQLTVPGSNRSSRVSANLPAWAGATAEVTLTAFWVNNTLDFEITNNDTGNNAVSAGHVELTAHFVRTTTPALIPEGETEVPLGQVHANMPFIVELRNGTIWIYTNSSRGEYDTGYSVASLTNDSITGGTRDVYYIASGATVTQEKYNTINSLADSPYLGMYRDVVSSENVLTIDSQFVSKSETGEYISMSDLLRRIKVLEANQS